MLPGHPVAGQRGALHQVVLSKGARPAPVLEVVIETSVRIRFSELPRVHGIAHGAYADTAVTKYIRAGTDAWQVVEGSTCKLGQPGAAASVKLPSSECVVLYLPSARSW